MFESKQSASQRASLVFLLYLKAYILVGPVLAMLSETRTATEVYTTARSSQKRSGKGGKSARPRINRRPNARVGVQINRQQALNYILFFFCEGLNYILCYCSTPNCLFRQKKKN